MIKALSKKACNNEVKKEILKLQTSLGDIDDKKIIELVESRLLNLSIIIDGKLSEINKSIQFSENRFDECLSQVESCQKTCYSKVDKQIFDHFISTKVEPDLNLLKSEITSKIGNQTFKKFSEDINKYIEANNASLETTNREINNAFNILLKQSKNTEILEKKFDQQIDAVCIDYAQLYGCLAEKQKYDDKRIKEIINCLDQLELSFDKTITHEIKTLNQKVDNTYLTVKGELFEKFEEQKKYINNLNQNSLNEMDILKSKTDQALSKIPYMEQRIDSVFNEIDNKISISLKILETKIKENDDRVTLIGKIQETQNLLQLQENQIQTFSKKIETIKNQSISNSNLNEFERRVEKLIEEKASSIELSNTHEKIINETNLENKKLFNYLENSFKVFEEEIQKFVERKFTESNKANKDKELIETNTNNSISKTETQLYSIPSSTKDIKVINSNIEKFKTTVYEQFASKEEFKETKLLFNDLKMIVNTNLEKSKSLINLQDSLKDTFLEEIEKIKTELTKKCNSEALDSMIETQTQINDFLCSENCLGRWLWQSGTLINKYLIPWETQVINTVPENFFWEKNQYTIVILSKGLYDVSIGVFTDSKKVKITLNLNGEILLSNIKKNYNIDEEGNMIKYSFIGKEKEEVYHGCSIRKVISLPTRARLSVSIFTDNSAEGYFSIKKL